MSNIKYVGMITLLSPMAHNSDESCGTDTKFRRINNIYNGESIRIPVYSGNAFRGILRRIAARQFCDLLGFGKKSMSDRLYYTWFTGGMLEKGYAGDYIEVGQKRELRAMIPFLSLFGCALQNQIMPGKLLVDIGIPVSKETAHMTGIASDTSIFDMTDEVFYTRRDDLEDPTQPKEQAQQMKYTIEVLSPGVVLKHDIVLEIAKAMDEDEAKQQEVEKACLGHAMARIYADGVLGGKSGTGHGRVKFEYAPMFADAKLYLDYVAENKEKILTYVAKMQGK